MDDAEPSTGEVAAAPAVRAAGPAPGSTFYALGAPAYRVLWLNATLLLTAVNLCFTAHSVVAFDLTGKNSSVGVVSFAIGAGLLLTTPLAGAIADRMSKRLLLALTESLFVVMSASIATLLFAHALTIGLLAIGGLLFGTSISFFWPAITAYMGDVVEQDRQANGAALFQVSVNFTRSFAPFVAGGLLSWGLVGFGGTYVVVSLITGATLLSIALIPQPKPPTTAAQRSSMLLEMKLGLRHVMERRPLKVAMFTFIIVILLGYSMMVVLPAYAKDVLGGGEAGFGIMFGVHAIGGLIAGVTVAARSNSPRLHVYMLVSSVALGASICVAALMPSFATGLIAILVVGAAAGAFQTLVMAAILNASEPEYYGRVMALTNVGWAMNNLFGLVLGIAADLTNERMALVGLGLLLIGVSILLSIWGQRGETSGVLKTATV
ncbi:MAG TPA: MFS transporter [Dehalococcoidia bacterium]|nr:MFS transporter [Dehalococcoidia bacterium]